MFQLVYKSIAIHLFVFSSVQRLFHSLFQMKLKMTTNIFDSLALPCFLNYLN